MARRTLVTAALDGSRLEPEGLEERIARLIPANGRGSYYPNTDAGDGSTREDQEGISFGYDSRPEYASYNILGGEESLLLRAWNAHDTSWENVLSLSQNGSLPSIASFSGLVYAPNLSLAESSPVFAATITPSGSVGIIKINLTGNCLIASPTTMYTGAEITFILRQDATGGRVVTFNAIFKKVSTLPTTASTQNVITFLASSTGHWIEKSQALGVPL